MRPRTCTVGLALILLAACGGPDDATTGTATTADTTPTTEPTTATMTISPTDTATSETDTPSPTASPSPTGSPTDDTASPTQTSAASADDAEYCDTLAEIPEVQGRLVSVLSEVLGQALNTESPGEVDTTEFNDEIVAVVSDITDITTEVAEVAPPELQEPWEVTRDFYQQVLPEVETADDAAQAFTDFSETLSQEQADALAAADETFRQDTEERCGFSIEPSLG